MARVGKAFFDNKGGFHKTPEDATMSDLAALLGKIGEGESLSLGIAHVLLVKRAEIEILFEQYDRMKADTDNAILGSDNVTPIPKPRAN